MTNQIPVLSSKPPEKEDIRMVTFFDDIDKNQLSFLNEAGKRITELSTALLGLLFTVTTYSNNFPPTYLKHNFLAQILTILTLMSYFLAMGAGLITVQPRTYNRWENNLTENRNEFNRLIKYKKNWFQASSLLFGLACFWLVALVATILIFS